MENGALLNPPPAPEIRTDGDSRTRRRLEDISRLRRVARRLGYGALRAVQVLARAVPRSTALAVGRSMGGLLSVGGKRRHKRKRVRRHLAIAFPDAPAAERRSLQHRISARLGENFAEVLRLGMASRQEIGRLVRFEGREHMDEALAARHGVILVTGHIGCWELMAAAIALEGYPLNVIARELFDPRLDQLLVTTRSRHGVKTIQREDAAAAREILRTLKRGEILGMLIDVDISASGAFVPFFGRPAWTPTGAAAFSMRARAPVVMGFINRDGDGHVVRFERPLLPVSSGDRDADLRENTARYTAAIEAAIRRQPEDWVWTHRRWRRVPGPDGAPYLPHDLPPAEADGS